MPICLCIFHGCFQTGWSIYDRDHMAYKAWKIYWLDFSEKVCWPSLLKKIILFQEQILTSLPCPLLLFLLIFPQFCSSFTFLYFSLLWKRHLSYRSLTSSFLEPPITVATVGLSLAWGVRPHSQIQLQISQDGLGLSIHSVLILDLTLASHLVCYWSKPRFGFCFCFFVCFVFSKLAENTLVRGSVFWATCLDTEKAFSQKGNRV